MRKNGKKALAFSLAFAMMMSVTPVSAAAKPTLSAKAKTISVGDKTTLTVKNKPAKATYSFTSSNKKVATVTKSGAVTGKKVGTTTITCNVKNGSKTTKLTTKITVVQSKDAGTKTITAGETATLKVNQYKGAKYYWKSTNTAVASVNSKGVVTAKKAGTATIRVRVDSTNAKYIAKYTVKVNTTKTVATQAQLNAALKNKKITSLTIATNKNVNFTIPNGTYKNVALIVDAPKADVTNNGTFKSILVKDVKSSTWHEKATGNRITVRDVDANIVVEKGAVVDAMSFTTKNSKAKLQINGEVKQVKTTKDNNVDVTVDGTLGTLALNSGSDVTLGGATKDSVKVTTNKNSTDAKLSTSVKVGVETGVKITVVLQKGAEGSSVTITVKDVTITLTNSTEEKVTVTTPSGTTEVKTGETVAVGGDSTDDGNSGNNGGGSTGGGSTGGDVSDSGDTGVTDTYEISVDQPTVTLNVGDTTNVVANLTKNSQPVTSSAVTWTSSDEATAKVESVSHDPETAKITGVAGGTATITATYEGQTATVKVTVNDNSNVDSTLKFSTVEDADLLSGAAIKYFDGKVDAASGTAIAASCAGITVDQKETTVTISHGVATGDAIFAPVNVTLSGGALTANDIDPTSNAQVVTVGDKWVLVITSKVGEEAKVTIKGTAYTFKVEAVEQLDK